MNHKICNSTGQSWGGNFHGIWWTGSSNSRGHVYLKLNDHDPISSNREFVFFFFYLIMIDIDTLQSVFFCLFETKFQSHACEWLNSLQPVLGGKKWEEDIYERKVFVSFVLTVITDNVQRKQHLKFHFGAIILAMRNRD